MQEYTVHKSRIRKSLMIAFLVACVLCLTFLAGCAALEDFVKTTKGALVGNSYTVYRFRREDPHLKERK